MGLRPLGSTFATFLLGCMPGESGMFDYVMILASIIIGLALAHLMQGIVTLVT